MLDLHQHVGEFELDGLELRDRAAELVAFLGVFERLVVGAHRHPHRQRRHRDPAAVEDREELVQPLAALAEQILLGHFGVGER